MKMLNIRFMLVVLICVTSIKAFAYDFEVNGMYFNVVSISDFTCEVTYGNSKQCTYSGSVVVPESVEYKGRSLKVVGIGESAFSGIEREPAVTSISLPDGIEYIGAYAFCKTSIKEFRVPSSLREIGYYAFSNSNWAFDHIERVYIKDLKSWCEVRIDGAEATPFTYYSTGNWADYTPSYNNTELWVNGKPCETLVIPDGVTMINDYVFACISSIKKVVLPNQIETIGKYAFCNSKNLETVVIPSCKTIDFAAFRGCEKLNNITLPEGLHSIGSYAFEECVSLSAIVFPSSVEELGEEIFGKSNLDYLKIDAAETPLLLAPYSLYDVETLNIQRKFRHSIHYIRTGNPGYYGSPFAFRSYPLQVTNLKEIEIGEEIDTIPKQSFIYCDKLKKLTIDDGTDSLYIYYYEQTKTINRCTYSHYSFSEFAIKPITDLYLGRPLAKKGNKIDNTNFDIFAANLELKNIHIGNYVESLEYFDLNNYKDLISITFGNKITSIPNMSACEKLDSIVVVNSTPPSAVGFANNVYLHARLYVPKGSMEKYMKADIWKNFWEIRELDSNLLGIDVEHNQSKEGKWFSISGILLSSPHKGVNIIKTNKGVNKKVLVK